MRVAGTFTIGGVTLPTSDRRAPRAEARGALTRAFAIAGALAIGIFSAVMALLLSHFLESRMLQRDAAVSRDFVQSIAATQGLADVLATAGGRAAEHPQFAEFVDHLAAMRGVLRVNVYAPDRVVLWSTRGELVGRRFTVNEELERALGGAVIVHSAAAPDKAEHVLLGPGPGRYVENYLPVYADDGRTPIAVVELYRRPDALFEAIASGQRLVAAGAAGGGLFLFAALLGFVVHVERRLREQQHRLVEAEAMAVVGEISAAVAHSIRNPLGSIRSSAELQRELAGDDSGALTDIMRHADRIEQLVRGMLAYAAATPAGGTHTDLDAVAADVAGSFAPELGKQRKRLEVDVGHGAGRVDADALLIAQIVQSLLTNAAEATREGGRIRLHTRREGAMAVLEVSDDGVGIAPERLGRVAEPFRTTKPRGLGMGLALAQRVARRLGGSFEIRSAPQQGTQVRLLLPARPD